MAVVAERAHMGRRRRRWQSGSGKWIVIDADLIENERMPHAIGAPLMEGDALRVLRLKGINGAGLTVGERDANLHPAAGGDIAGILPQIKRFAEATGKFRHFPTYACVGEHDLRQIGGRYRLRSKNPEIQVLSAQLRKAIAKVDGSYLRQPSAPGSGLPRQANGVWRRQKNLGVDRQATVFLFEKALPRSLPCAVEIIVRSQAVIKNDVTVVVRSRVRKRSEHAKRDRENQKMLGARTAQLTGNEIHFVPFPRLTSAKPRLLPEPFKEQEPVLASLNVALPSPRFNDSSRPTVYSETEPLPRPSIL